MTDRPKIEIIHQLEEDAEYVHQGALALERNGAPRRLISDVRKRRDEYLEMADNMRRDAGL